MSEEATGGESRPAGGLHLTQPFRVLGRRVGLAASKQGVAPGTLVPSPTAPREAARLLTISYDGDFIDERLLASPEEIEHTGRVLWLNLDGVHDVDAIRQVADRFDLHPLLVEDVVSVGQRSKFEDYEQDLFLVLPMLTVAPDGFRVINEQITFVLGDGVLLTFQERPGDVFEPVRERLRQSTRRIRSRGADYLCYALMDAVVDGYFQVLDRLGNATEEIDDELNDDPGPDTIRRIHDLKRETLILRRAIWPLREALGGFIRAETPLVTDETRVFLRDVYDHVLHVIDATESIREVVGGMMDLYLSIVGHRTNEVMRLLTVMASIFIPLTFLAGIYGMNFQNMPELAKPWGYPVLLGFMAVVGIGLLAYFKRRGWL